MSYMIKRDMVRFINKMHRFSNQLANLQLEIIARKRDLVYTNKQLVANRSRGNAKNIKRGTGHFFWNFKGSFWADELGDYSFGLKSNCKLVRKEKEI